MSPILILLVLVSLVCPVFSQCPVNLDLSTLCTCSVIQNGYSIVCRGVNQSQLNERVLSNVNLQNVGEVELTVRDFQGIITRWPENSNVLRNQLRKLFFINANLIRVLPIFSWAGALTELHLEGLPAISNVDLHGSALPRNLRVLRFVSTRITKVNQEMIGVLRNLTELEFSGHAHLEIIGEPFRNLTKLEVLKINGGLGSLEENSLKGLNNIKELNLSWNGLGELKTGALDDLHSLVVLDLSENDLTTLPENLLINSPHLRYISLRNNALTSLPKGCIQNSDVTTVDLSENHLATLPAHLFSNTTRLRSVNLSKNKLGTVSSGMFAEMGSVEELELQENDLVYLGEDAFSGLNELKVLNLSYNRIDRIGSNAFRGLDQLQGLDLRGNRILVIEDVSFIGMRNLTDLLLTGNTLTCACRNLPIADYLTANHTTAADLLCVDPRTYQLQSLFALNATNCAADLGYSIFTTPLEGLLLALSVLCGALVVIGLGVACICAHDPRLYQYRDSYPQDYGTDTYKAGDVEIREIKGESQVTIL